MYLFAAYVLETLGYRRFEWKCDALNAPSRRAALRFGFTWEGHFRRAVIVRGRTRDTAWYAMIDDEWLALKEAYERWLAPEKLRREGAAEDPAERPHRGRPRPLNRPGPAPRPDGAPSFRASCHSGRKRVSSSVAARANSVMLAQSAAATRAAGAIQEPPTQATLARAR